MRIALFPGTFDPITLGHVDVINRALPLFDKIIIGIGINSTKKPMFTIEQRLDWISKIFEGNTKVEGYAYEGLTIEHCKKLNAQFILRGIRYVSDFEYEKGIADMNRMLSKNIETVFLTSSPEYSTVSSTLVRDVIRYNGDVSQFIPPQVKW
ncbi:MAG TPA: pantetheine-phosphate adenylyltransferase [Edaphocola sp.]|nr:pantetheine-phosphate adenylyltransferase [Edaphocola sp.]